VYAARPYSPQEFVQRQAEWAEEVADYAAAADMYLKAKRWDKAIMLIGKNEWKDKLVEVMRTLEKTDVKPLQARPGACTSLTSHTHSFS